MNSPHTSRINLFGPVLLGIAPAVLVMLVGGVTNFHPPLNDFWGNLFLARHLRLNDIAGWHDGFFPAGYTLLLTLSPSFLFAPAFGFMVNALLIVPFFWAIRISSRQFGLNGMWQFGLCLSILLFPRLFHYSVTPGADFGAMVFFSGGVIALFSTLDSSEPVCKKLIALSGLMLGFSALWRYHGLAAGVLFLGTTALFRPSRWKAILSAGAIMAAVFFPQIVASLAAHKGLLGTYQYFNIYRSIYDVNWYRVGDLTIPRSVFRSIANDPAVFVGSWAISFGKIVIIPLTSSFAAFIFRKDLRRHALVWGLFSMAYAAVVAVADSGRAVLFLLPLSIIFGFATVKGIVHTPRVRKQPTLRVAFFGLIVAALVAFTVRDFQKVVSWRDQMDTYRETEDSLIVRGITSGSEVYSTDYDQYFRTIRPYRPVASGGWLALDEYSHLRDHRSPPRLQSDSLFFSDCLSQGIKVLCLGPNSGRAANFLGSIYDQNFLKYPVEPLATSGDLKVFALTGR